MGGLSPVFKRLGFGWILVWELGSNGMVKELQMLSFENFVVVVVAHRPLFSSVFVELEKISYHVWVVP